VVVVFWWWRFWWWWWFGFGGWLTKLLCEKKNRLDDKDMTVGIVVVVVA
jgi:hypothetical protein